MDINGLVYIADKGNNAIRILDLTTNVTTLTNSNPTYVTDMHGVVVSTNYSIELNNPEGLAVSPDGSTLFVSDTDNHCIKRILLSNGAATNVTIIAGNTNKISGMEDALFGTDALFDTPTGLIWMGGNQGLLVCDTGNHVIRQIYTNPDLADLFPDEPEAEYSVNLYAGTQNPGAQVPVFGYVDGPAEKALFHSPIGITINQTGGYMIVDSANNVIRLIELTSGGSTIAAPRLLWRQGYQTPRSFPSGF